MYLQAVADNFEWNEVDYAMLVKQYGESPEPDKRYSPAICIGCRKNEITGCPDPKHISTSFVERQNLTMRMSMRRFTLLTNGFSKKIANHIAALAVYFMYYNYARLHQTLKTTPAIAAGITNRKWSIGDIVSLLDSN